MIKICKVGLLSFIGVHSFCKKRWNIFEASLKATFKYCFTWFWFSNFSIFLACLGFTIECLLDHIKDTAHADSTEEVLEWKEGISDAEEEGGELEVDKEDDNTKVDQSMRSGDHIRLLINDKDQSRQETSFSGAETENIFEGKMQDIV